MKTVAVIGASGFVGSAVGNALQALDRYTVTLVTRANYTSVAGKPFDIVINAAMPSGRFWAKNNPEKDFAETVEKTATILYTWQFTKLVHISTLSARCQLDTVYGRHKAAAEALIDHNRHLIVRLGPMFDATLTKGVLIDMLEAKPVYVSGDSRYCFASLGFVSQWIATHLDDVGVREVGAQNAIVLKDVAKYLQKNIEFDGLIDVQEITDPSPDFPLADEVYSYLDGKVGQ